MSLIKETELYIDSILTTLGYNYKSNLISSSMPKFGQFQLNIAMPLANIYHKNPLDIANEIISKFDDRFINVNIASPGFINLSFNNKIIIDYLNKAIKDFNTHVDESQKKTIVIDYGGANAAKSLHVGHMRSANIGESLKRIAKLYGNIVIGDVHLGDLGRQAGMLIYELKSEQPDLVFFDDKYEGKYPKINLTANDLGIMYPLASAKAKENEEIMEEVRLITKEVEEGRRGYLELWKQMVEISSTEIKKVYDRLNCTFDLWDGEMDSLNYIEDVLKILKPYLYESDNALVMDVADPKDKKEIPPLMVLKSDGTSIYSTRDLATIYKRMKNYNPDEIWYVVDQRQALNFTQVFRASYKSSLVKEQTKLLHLGFGTINGTDGKPFKTRDGGVMQLSQLIDIIGKEISKRNKSSIPKEEQKDITEKLTIATIKYTDLLPYRMTDYIFDPTKFASLEGKTGPYILYTLVRCKSLLRNNEPIKYHINCINDNIIDIYLKIVSLSNCLYKAYTNTSPNLICEYLFDLCNLFNKFYNDINISKKENIELKTNYLSLTYLVSITISKLLDLLAIDSLERM